MLRDATQYVGLTTTGHHKIFHSEDSEAFLPRAQTNPNIYRR